MFDFGGGTLDVSIIRVTTSGNELCIDPIGRSRYNNLGGDDIDIELASFFLGLWEHQDARRLETLEQDERKELVQLFVQRSSAFKEEAEYYLANDQPLNEFIIDHELTKSHWTLHFQCQLTRPQYEEISGRFFLDKGDLNVFRPIGQALDVARSIVPGFRKDDIDLVLYTGGASRMTGLRAALETYFAPKPCFSITDEEACNTVALGAASCRYDEMQGQRGVRTTSRLLESIFTRDDETGLHSWVQNRDASRWWRPFIKPQRWLGSGGILRFTKRSTRTHKRTLPSNSIQVAIMPLTIARRTRLRFSPSSAL